MPQIKGYKFPRQTCPGCGREVAVGTPHVHNNVNCVYQRPHNRPGTRTPCKVSLVRRDETPLDRAVQAARQ